MCSRANGGLGLDPRKIKRSKFPQILWSSWLPFDPISTTPPGGVGPEPVGLPYMTLCCRVLDNWEATSRRHKQGCVSLACRVWPVLLRSAEWKQAGEQQWLCVCWPHAKQETAFAWWSLLKKQLSHGSYTEQIRRWIWKLVCSGIMSFYLL